MTSDRPTAERLAAFSDAVFAVIVTIMVLELDAPEDASFAALLPLWPTAVSYAVSFLFVAIIWINHHHLMRFVGEPTLRLIWVNFAHLFLVSLLPFATAWVARTQLGSSPVVLYGALFVCIDLVYNLFERDILARVDAARLAPEVRSRSRRRSLAVLAGFTAATLLAFVAPYAAFALICAALILHVDPRATSFRTRT